jgi:hypothetical protein
VSASKVAFKSDLALLFAIARKEVQNFNQEEIIWLLPFGVRLKDVCKEAAIITEKAILGSH